MNFIDIPTEQTTAVTDAILAIITIMSAVYLLLLSKYDQWKATLWVCLFSLLALASALGSIVHGLQMPVMLKTLLWHPLNLSLGLAVGIFITAVVYDIWGKNLAKKILPIMLLIGAGFFCITLVWPDSFLVFIIYEAAAMLFALGGYISLVYRRHLKGAFSMALGIFVTIIASGVQAANSFSFTFIWAFDHNGVYHLVQMAGILLLLSGLRTALHKQREDLPG